MLLASKVLVMGLTWLGAFVFSFGLRFWGSLHLEPFLIRPFVVLALLLGPTVVLGVWLLVQTLSQDDAFNRRGVKSLSDSAEL